QLLGLAKAHDAAIDIGAFSPDGRHAVTGAADGTIKVWDLAAQKAIAGFRHAEAVHGGGFLPDGQSLASASHDGQVQLWTLLAGAEVRTFAGHRDKVLALAATRDGKRLVSASLDRTLRVWDVATGECQRTCEWEWPLTSVDVTPD